MKRAANSFSLFFKALFLSSPNLAWQIFLACRVRVRSCEDGASSALEKRRDEKRKEMRKACMKVAYRRSRRRKALHHYSPFFSAAASGGGRCRYERGFQLLVAIIFARKDVSSFSSETLSDLPSSSLSPIFRLLLSCFVRTWPFKVL